MMVYTTNSYVTIQFSVHYRKNIAFHMEFPQTEGEVKTEQNLSDRFKPS